MNSRRRASLREIAGIIRRAPTPLNYEPAPSCANPHPIGVKAGEFLCREFIVVRFVIITEWLNGLVWSSSQGLGDRVVAAP